jgi:septal ring-binding cell division protein DamX
MADFKGSGTDTVVKIVLVFFISLLSFSIGTFVGKKFSDNQHRMTAMEPKKHMGNETSTAFQENDSHKPEHSDNGKQESKVAHEPQVVNDDQIAEIEQEMVANEELSSYDEKATVTEDSNEHTSDKKAVKTAPKNEAKAEVGNIHSKDPETASANPEKATTNRLARELANQGTGNFTIQIASYPSLELAEKKVQELKSLKFDSFTTEALIKGHQWYRVNVGMFATIKEAQEHKTLLAERAKVSSAIIQKLKK